MALVSEFLALPKEKEYKYVIQRSYQTDMAKKVGSAMARIFEEVLFNSLHVLEDIATITCPKALPKGKVKELCAMLLEKAREEGDTDTLSFGVVPYNESIAGKQKQGIK